MELEQLDWQTDIEVYVRHSSELEVMRWLEEDLGPLHQVETIPIIYHSARAGPQVSVIIQEGIGDGTYMGVMIAPNITRWATDADLARAAFEALGQEIRCDPGPLGPAPWQFLEITPSGEAVVEWWDPEDDVE
ncbi:MAG: hypothetical protein Rubg2KO_01290 [Rubricoccaceae bacterium]